MQIHGLNRTTLLDYPGQVAATVFTGGCNFRCPFCHNKLLVMEPESQPLLMEEEVLSFLKKRKGILTGVCITGGEPTLQPDLKLFLQNVREIGLLIKLDTNGYRPEVLQDCVESGLVDYVAMDIKASGEGYGEATGMTGLEIEKIVRSAEFLLQNKVSYEFRTTVVKELHSVEEIEKIGEWIKGAEAYFLQSYEENENVIAPGFHACTKEELVRFQEILQKYMKKVELRGVD